MNLKKFTLGLMAALLLVLSFVAPFVVRAEEVDTNSALAQHVEMGQTPKNIVLLIPDGMGTNDMMAYRQYKNGGFAPILPPTVMDDYLVGMMMTSADADLSAGESSVTDSAAAGTAMASGEKTYSGAIGVNREGAPVESASEVAKAQGKSVGIIATSDVFHATPAAFHSHVASRKNYDEMLANMVATLEAGEELPFDMLLGGGQSIFAEVTDLFEEAGYDYVETKEELTASESDMVLGLFAPDALPYHWDTVEETMPTIVDMTQAALDKLSQNENGFFLMIEASQIDWANHANDITGMISDMEGFEQTFETIINFAKEDGETLVIAGADHETGGFTISGGDTQQFLIDPVFNMKHTPQLIAQLVVDAEDAAAAVQEYTGITLTMSETIAIEDGKVNGDAYDVVYGMLIDKINAATNAGWSTGEHTGGEVAFYAYGPGYENFIGLIDNTDVGSYVKTVFGGSEVQAETEAVAETETEAEAETEVATEAQ